MIKIAYDSQIFCAQQFGGVSRYFSEIASRIAAYRDVSVQVIAPMSINSYLDAMPRDLVRGRLAPGLSRHRRFNRAAGVAVGDLMLRAYRPDLIHETYFFPYRLGPRRAKRVVTVHDMIHEKFPEYFPVADTTARFKSKSIERADHVICVSESTRRDAMQILGLPPEKVTVIHHGFSLMNVANAAAPSATWKPRGPYLLYVGHRGGYKNFYRLLNAFGNSQFLRTNFQLVCFGGGAFNDPERSMMAKLRLGEREVIQMAGGDDILSALYRGAGALVYPSLYEGFGIPPLEAMSFDCPVVCSDTSSIPEVVSDAGEYFDPYDEESIQRAVELVVASQERRKALVEAGRKRLSTFSWAQCALETYAVYRKLI